jgi:hypothetical protein
VYRLPKITYESGGKSRPFENHESGDKAGHKWGISGGKSTPNNINNRTTNKYHDELTTLGKSTPSTSTDAQVGKSGFVVEGHQNQNQPTQSHIKWREYDVWCRSKGGIPSEKGFWTWLSKQKPQWRNKVKKSFNEPGYVLDGKFFTVARQTRWANRTPNSSPNSAEAERVVTKSRSFNPSDGGSGEIWREGCV